MVYHRVSSFLRKNTIVVLSSLVQVKYDRTEQLLGFFAWKEPKHTWTKGAHVLASKPRARFRQLSFCFFPNWNRACFSMKTLNSHGSHDGFSSSWPVVGSGQTRTDVRSRIVTKWPPCRQHRGRIGSRHETPSWREDFSIIVKDWLDDDDEYICSYSRVYQFFANAKWISISMEICAMTFLLRFL